VIALALAMAQATDTWPSDGVGSAVRGIAAVIFVLGLLVLLAWLARKGHLPLGRTGRGGPILVEATVPLGERRSLTIVSVEGRRLLLGLTAAHVSLLAELAPASDADAFGRALGTAESKAVTPSVTSGRESSH